MKLTKKHHDVATRQYEYKVARQLAYEAGYKHKPRWRKTTLFADKSTRQFVYALFGPTFM